MGITLPSRARAPRALARVSVIAAAALVPVLTPVAAGADSDTLAHQMYKLRVCESSNRYHLDTGNGYYGAYQFDLRTWRGLGMRGYPHRAGKATQSTAARKLHDRRGWRPWPACARRMHLH